MKLAFLDSARWDYNVASVEHTPMGGSQSAACYLAAALAAGGHEIWYVNHTSVAGEFHGVHCLSWAWGGNSQLRELDLDALVIIQRAGLGRKLRESLGPGMRIILWSADTPNQQVVAALGDPAERDAYDHFAMVSPWQAQQFQEKFSIEPSRIAIARYAAAPAFVSLFAGQTPILPEKAAPPVLAYTSAPYRGLDVLLDVFPEIVAKVPGIRLEVFSSMTTHGQTAGQDQEKYGALYDRCHQTPGVEYVGSLPQPQLAERMRRVSVLAYPNTFKETFCIAALEAMAAGCQVVTSDLAALPETTAGFARLIPVGEGRDVYKEKFIDAVVEALRAAQTDPAATETRLRRQVEYVTQNCTWPLRAVQWAQWLSRPS